MAKQFIVRGDIQQEPALIIKDQVLLGPGKWNGKLITGAEIRRGMSNTDWTDSQRRSIVYGHRVDGDPSPDMWIGSHSIPEYKTPATHDVTDEGMYADLFIYDDSLARKLAYGKVKAGVSERLEFQDDYDGIKIDGFLNLSVVDNPACKISFLNLSDEGDKHIAEILSPQLLNLADNGKTDLSRLERGSDEVKMSDKLDNMESRLNALETQKLNLGDGDAPTTPVTPATPVAPVAPVVQAPVTPTQPADPVTPTASAVVEPVKAPEPVTPSEPAKPTEPVISAPAKDPVILAPVVMNADSAKVANTEVVDAIKEMSKTMTDELHKVANPQSVAPTNPDASMSNLDDEVRDNLVKQYFDLHPENSHE